MQNHSRDSGLSDFRQWFVDTGGPYLYRSGPVEVTILMPLPIFDGFVDRCDKNSREFAILRNGVMIRVSKEDHFERMLEIRCDMVDAERLGFLATAVYPEAVDAIARAIAAARKS